MPTGPRTSVATKACAAFSTSALRATQAAEVALRDVNLGVWHPAMTPEQFIAKWKAADLKERAAAQSHFNDLCRLLDEPKPDRRRPQGRVVLLRARRHQDDRWRRLGGCLEARLLRLGVQEPRPQPRRSDRPAEALRPGAGKPAAADRLQPRPLPDRHQLDQRGLGPPRVRPRRPARAGEPREAQMGVRRARAAAPGPDAPPRHRDRGREVRGPGPGPARQGPRPAGRGALRQPPGVLHVRRGHRAPAERDVHAHARGGASDADRVRAALPLPVRRHAGRRPPRIRAGRMVQWRPVRR